MFVDSSALVAMLVPEFDGAVLMGRLQERRETFTSPVVVFESALALRRQKQIPVADALLNITDFLREAQIRCLDIRSDSFHSALRAFERFGKGTGHPAGLNMGDCFSYAMANDNGVGLLYKGDDFAQTDLA